MQAPMWTTLEIAKLSVSLLTPLLVLILGIIINHSIRAAERSTALRSDIYRAIGGDLNDIYSYLAFVGGWKDLGPKDVIARKRAVDKAMFTYRPFFSKELFRTYEAFMKEAFEPYEAPVLTHAFAAPSQRPTAIVASTRLEVGRRPGRIDSAERLTRTRRVMHMSAFYLNWHAT